MKDGLVVPVNSSDVQFNEVVFKPCFKWVDGFTTIELDMSEFMDAHIQGYVASPDQWDESYYSRKIKSFENSHNCPIETAYVHCLDSSRRIERWFKKDEFFIKPSITYTNGRHRNKLLQYLGASSLYVTVENCEIDKFREHFMLLNEYPHSAKVGIAVK